MMYRILHRSKNGKGFWRPYIPVPSDDRWLDRLDLETGELRFDTLGEALGAIIEIDTSGANAEYKTEKIEGDEGDIIHIKRDKFESGF